MGHRACARDTVPLREVNVAYLTDIEGRWDKLESFASGNPHVALEDGALRLADGVTFVFGGDAIDRGPHGRKIVDLLLRARKDYGERVVLLAGNRDINKLRLRPELDGNPPPSMPADVRSQPRGAQLRWILANTMGAKDAFRHRVAELEREGEKADDEAVVESYLADVAPGGAIRRYLLECKIAHRAGSTLFLHGGVTIENINLAPGRSTRARDVDQWVEWLDDFYRTELDAFEEQLSVSPLLTYQAPLAGTRFNQQSVVYARLADTNGNPLLPDAAAVGKLRASGIGRLVVGHTPSGDSPSFVRDRDFELILADNSYGRIERGSQLFLTEHEARVRAYTKLDDGSEHLVAFTTDRRDVDSPLGKRDRKTGHLVKGLLENGDYLLYRGLPKYEVEQLGEDATAIARRALDQ